MPKIHQTERQKRAALSRRDRILKTQHFLAMEYAKHLDNFIRQNRRQRT